MNTEDELALLATEEASLQFSSFNTDTAWEIGSELKAEAERRGVAVSIDIQLARHTLFHYAMRGTSPDNAEWIRRKRNVVNRFHKSSYAIGLRLQQRNSTLEERYGLGLNDYAAHGGCFPLIIKDTGCVGTITVSGAPQLDDHQIVTTVISRFLKLTAR